MKSKDQNNPLLQATHNLRVRFSEVDSLGIVWHGNYISYFEEGREAFGRTYGLSYLDIKAKGFAAPIVKMASEHQLPLKYGQLATIETTYIDSRAAKLSFSYRILNENGQTVCTGKTTQVFTDLETGDMALTLPIFYRLWKEKFHIEND